MMSMKQLIASVQNETKHGACKKDKILLLCEKAENMRIALENIRDVDWLPTEVDDLAKEALEKEE